MGGWFFIDFVSVFPFDAMFGSGIYTRLFRLARLPRLLKLLDQNRFKKILKSFQGKNTNEQTIMKQYEAMFIYNLIRLIVIACFITYFIGCMFFFISQDLNTEKDVKEGHTFF